MTPERKQRAAEFLGRPLPLWTGALSLCIALGQAFDVIEWSGEQMGAVQAATGAVLLLAGYQGGGDE